MPLAGSTPTQDTTNVSDDIKELERKILYYTEKKNKLKEKEWREVHGRKTAEKLKEIKESLCPQLIQCCNFDYLAFLNDLVSLLVRKELRGCAPTNNVVLAGGYPQSGKTIFKVIAAIANNHMGYPTVIVTKGVSEAIELTNKISSAIARDLCATIPVTYISNGRKTVDRDALDNILNESGVLVLAATHHQIQKASRLLRNQRGSMDNMTKFGYILINDEADDFIRTPDEAQQMEKALKILMGDGTGLNGLRPTIQLSISATLVPIAFSLERKSREVFGLHLTKPSKEYVSLMDLEGFRDPINRKILSLEANDLTRNNGYSNEYTKLFEKDAAEKCKTLYLDISSPRVYADNNIFDKANNAQETHPHICVLVYAGSGIKFRRPGDAQNEWQTPRTIFKNGKERKKTIGEVINDLDIDATVGLKTPIFIFGYTKMQRGCSFRSDNRVPTHILLFLGRCQSMEKMVQALGRAAFNGKSTLEKNGFKKVKVLTKAVDLKSAIRYNKFFIGLYKKLVYDGKSLQDCLKCNSLWKINEDFLLGEEITRPIGAKKLRFTEDYRKLAFEDTDEDTDEDTYIDRDIKNDLDSIEEEEKIDILVLDTMKQCTRQAMETPCSASAGKSTPLDYPLIMERFLHLHTGKGCTEFHLEPSLERLVSSEVIEKQETHVPGVKRKSNGSGYTTNDTIYTYSLSQD